MKAMTRGILGKSSILLVIAMLVSLIAPGYAAEKPSNNSIAISSFTDKSGTININAGRGEGIKAGAKGIVQRDGKQIADYTVEKVNWGWSNISISNLVDGYTVRAGDIAPITGRSDKSTSIKKKSNTIWIIAAVVAAILLFSKHGSSKSTAGDTITLTAKKVTNPDSTTIDITANVKDAAGVAVPDQTVVTFSTTAGLVDPARVLTASGIAKTTLTKPSDATPTATVTVTALGKTNTIDVSFASSIDLSVSPSTIEMKGSGGTVTESTITAICRDASGNLATSGTIQFQANIGNITSSATIGTDGKATATFSSTTAGSADIAAKWLDSVANSKITVNAGAPFSITGRSSASSLPADGSSNATITATVKDFGGNMVTDGTIVNFSVIPDSTGGGNGTIASKAETVNGVATATLYSIDPLNSGKSKAGTATIKIQVLIANQPSGVPAPTTDRTSQDTTVLFVSPDPAKISLSADPTNIRALDKIGNTTTITAEVLNANGKVVPDGTVVTFSATHGLVTGNNSTTKDGIATATLRGDTSGGGWDGKVEVTATAGKTPVTGTCSVIFSGAPSLSNCTATITPSAASLSSVGGQATIQVIAKDINGNPVADGTSVIATPSKGTITAVGSTTTSDGNILFSLKTGDALTPTTQGAGTVTIMIDPGIQQVLLTVNYTVVP